MNRGFFSVFLAAFAIIFFISVVYVQSQQTDSSAKVSQLLVGEQELSKDWFLARNAYSNFAADAIISQIDLSPPVAPGCIVSPGNYASTIQSYFDSVHSFLLSKGVDCSAELSLELRNALEPPAQPTLSIGDDERGYAVLSCIRTVGGVDLNLTQPFVFRKDIRSSLAGPGQCSVDIYDRLGIDSEIPPVTEVALDVTKTYP